MFQYELTDQTQPKGTLSRKISDPRPCTIQARSEKVNIRDLEPTGPPDRTYKVRTQT